MNTNLVKCNDNSVTSQTPEETPSAEPKPSLLLGTSLLRNVDPEKLRNCEMVAKGGTTINDLHATLNNLPEDTQYDKITIIAGLIDVEKKLADEIVSEYQALLVAVSSKCEKAAICSVLPRMDKEMSTKTLKLNEDLKNMCQNDGHEFMDMDDTFLLRNGKANKACLLDDGLHLTKYGVDNLIQGCNIPLIESCDSAFTDTRYKKKKEKLNFKGHQSPLSNFYPVKGLYVDGI